MANRVTELFGIRYPIIQAGMVWASGWRLAPAVSNAGGLGLIGAGSMYPEVLSEHIQKCKKATSKPFGVNVPLLYPEIDLLMEVIIQEKCTDCIHCSRKSEIMDCTFKIERVYRGPCGQFSQICIKSPSMWSRCNRC